MSFKHNILYTFINNNIFYFTVDQRKKIELEMEEKHIQILEVQILFFVEGEKKPASFSKLKLGEVPCLLRIYCSGQVNGI